MINFKIQTATTKRVTLRNLFSSRNEYLKFNFILILTPIQFLPANTYLSTVIRCIEIISTIMSFWWTKIKEQKHKSYADQIDRRHMADCQTTENRRWCTRLLVHTMFLFASPSPPAWYLHWHLISIWANRRALNCDWCDKLVPRCSCVDQRAEMDTFEMEIETEIKRQRQFNAAVRHFYMHPINATPGARTICSSLKWHPHFGKCFLLDLPTVVFCLRLRPIGHYRLIQIATTVVWKAV